MNSHPKSALYVASLPVWSSSKSPNSKQQQAGGPTRRNRTVKSVNGIDLVSLPLVKLDFSCNKVAVIPVCYRKMSHLQTLQLDNNPLQSPPAQDYFSRFTVAAMHIEDIDQSRKQDTDSGLGSDNGDKRLSATEPSDEDTVSLNAPMSNITEEESFSKEDSSEHMNQFKEKPDQDSVKLFENNNPEEGPQDKFVTIPPDNQEIHIEMFNQLREAVELLQDPNRLNMNTEDSTGVQLYPVHTVTTENLNSSVNGQTYQDVSMTHTGEDKTPASSPTTNTPFGLKPRSVFLRTPRKLESMDPQFTIRRKMEQMREELDLMDQLREPKLSMAKCRRNVENFLDACRKMGVPEEKLCLPHHILEEKGLVKVSITIQALIDVSTTIQALFT
ncbi:Leucine-rich repeat and calponin homology domain-containing protein 1 [Acipenser ruthenus]|uniref:Leucine-rich repeat and calponin homology domain-containing protein 1 n=1 Tax=Acipenser ruthenus TaxID=7906 RepID=A0A662YMG9_ACIRT|nr:Leucine-rich repeat and calponin homology domain-containing protein 1 [Acipenser ruthenus]